MARSLNQVTLLGHVGSDPDLRYTNNGIPVANFRIATDRMRAGGVIGEPDWHSIVCWQKLAEIVNQYVHKGNKVLVTGRLSTSSYEQQDGQKRYRTEVVANEVIFLSSNGDKEPEPA